MCFSTFNTTQLFSVSYPLIYNRPKTMSRKQACVSCTYLVNSEIYSRSFSIAKFKKIVKFFFGLRLYLTENTVYLNYKEQLGRDINIHVYRRSCKLSYVYQILTKIWMRQRNLVKIPNMKFQENPSSGFAVLHDRTQTGTDGQTWLGL
jgi:hypothetical protein